MNNNLCDTCSLNPSASLKPLGSEVGNYDYTIALAGNPNTGKSTVLPSQGSASTQATGLAKQSLTPKVTSPSTNKNTESSICPAPTPSSLLPKMKK